VHYRIVRVRAVDKRELRLQTFTDFGVIGITGYIDQKTTIKNLRDKNNYDYIDRFVKDLLEYQPIRILDDITQGMKNPIVLKELKKLLSKLKKEFPECFV
jgi:hypothetical protein